MDGPGAKPLAPALPRENRPVMVPTTYLDSGRIVSPKDGQFEPVKGVDAKPVDPFEVADSLVAKYHRFCVVDLEGVRRNRPQLDYLQELSRSGELWVDAGIRTGDQVIDILVTGAQRTILSTGYLLSAKQLRRAWRLSSEILFAVETEGDRVRPRGNDWDGMSAADAISGARTVGVSDVILRSRGSPVDWSFVRQASAAGPLWVEGPPEPSLGSRLRESGVAGCLFDASPPELLAADTPRASE